MMMSETTNSTEVWWAIGHSL